MKKFYLLFVLLCLFTTRVYADSYPSPIVRFENSTTIKYLTDADKAVIMDKFALSEYDGAVVITNNPKFSYMLDYSNIKADYYNEYLDYDELMDYDGIISPFDNYSCAPFSGFPDEYQVMDIKRTDGKLSFARLYEMNQGYYICGDKTTKNINGNYITYEFQHEGLYIDSLDFEEEGTRIAKLLVYYVQNDSNAILNFKSSKTLNETKLTAITDMAGEPYTSKNILRDTKKFEAKYYGVLHEEDNEAIKDMIGIEYNDGQVVLINEDGGNFYFDFDESTIKQDDIYLIEVQYFNLKRDSEELTFDDWYYEKYRYAYGKLIEAESNYETINLDTSIDKGIPIRGMNDVALYDEECNGDDCDYTNSPADFVFVAIYSLDTDGWRGFSLAYDTPENRELLNFKEIIEADENYLKGDMNENGKIDLADIIALLKKYLNNDATDKDIKIGDMDTDGNIGLKDIIMLLKLYLAN